METSLRRMVVIGPKAKDRHASRRSHLPASPKCESLEGRQLLSTVGGSREGLPVLLRTPAQVDQQQPQVKRWAPGLQGGGDRQDLSFSVARNGRFGNLGNALEGTTQGGKLGRFNLRRASLMGTTDSEATVPTVVADPTDAISIDPATAMTEAPVETEATILPWFPGVDDNSGEPVSGDVSILPIKTGHHLSPIDGMGVSTYPVDFGGGIGAGSYGGIGLDGSMAAWDFAGSGGMANLGQYVTIANAASTDSGSMDRFVINDGLSEEAKAAFEKLGTDLQAIQDKSEVTPKLLAEVRKDFEQIQEQATADPDQDLVKTLNDRIEALDGQLPNDEQKAQLKADLTAVLQSQGITDQGLIDKTIADLDAVATATHITADDLATIAADRKAIEESLKSDEADVESPPVDVAVTGQSYLGGLTGGQSADGPMGGRFTVGRMGGKLGGRLRR